MESAGGPLPLFFRLPFRARWGPGSNPGEELHRNTWINLWRESARKLLLLLQEGIPLERLAGLALAQAIGAWISQRNLIQERAKQGDREKFLAALDKVPDVPPQAGDEL